jgi:hypothetical protein
MLTTQSYIVAFAVWWLAALVGLAVLLRWVPHRWPAWLRWGGMGLLAGLLMVPAPPQESAETLAPALVVAVFNTLFGEGWASAVPAVASLLVAMAGMAVIAGVLGGILAGRRERAANAANDSA